MNILRKFVWLLLVLGLLTLTVQTASPIAFVSSAEFTRGQKAEIIRKHASQFEKEHRRIIGSNCPKSVLLSDLPVRLPHPLGESAERGSPVYDPFLRRLAQEKTNR